MRNIFTLVVGLFLAYPNLFAQLSLDEVNRAYLIDFNNTIPNVNNGTFSASSVKWSQETPSPGHLDRDAFQVSQTEGVSFNWPNPLLDGTNGKGISFGGEDQAGIYAFLDGSADSRFIGFQADEDSYTPGAIILKIQNNSGNFISQFNLSYKTMVFNDQEGSQKVDFFWSTDGDNWNAVPELAFQSTYAAAPSPDWESFSLSTCLAPVEVPTYAYVYFKWVFDYNGGDGRDEMGIDDITIEGASPVYGFTQATAIVAEGDPDFEQGITTSSYQLDITMNAPPPQTDASFSIYTIDGTAVSVNPQPDFTAIPSIPPVIFSSNECYPQTKSVTLLIKRDVTIEANEHFFVNLVLTGPNPLLTPGITSQQVIIGNDDTLGASVLFSKKSGNWNATDMWSPNPSGSLGPFHSDPNNILGPDGPVYDLIIQSGHNVIMDSEKGINTLEVQTDGFIPGKLVAGNINLRFLEIYGDDVNISGNMGNSAIGDGIGLEIHGPTCTIRGGGAIELQQIRKTGSVDSELNIITDVQLIDDETVLYNNADDAAFNVNISSLSVVNIPSGDVSIDGQNGENAINARGTFNVEGVLNLLEGNLILRTDNPLPTTDDIVFQLQGTGSVNLGNQVLGNKDNSGGALAKLVMGENTTINCTKVGDVFLNFSSDRNGFDLHPLSLIVYEGILPQNISHEIPYASLKSEGGSLKTISGNTNVHGMLQLMSGNIELNDFDLTLTQDATSSEGTATSYIITNGTGRLKIHVNGLHAYTFPVGNSSFNPILLINNGTDDIFSAKVEDWVLTGGTNGSPFSEKAVNCTWFISEETPGGSNTTLFLKWKASQELSGFDRDNCNIIHHFGGNWVPGTLDSATPEGDLFFMTLNGINDFSPFAVASVDINLPVELSFFKATPQKSSIALDWQTLSEKDNDFFSVERSAENSVFREIGLVQGRGSSTAPVNYTLIDKTPFEGINYYRLKQIDVNGHQVYSKVISAKYSPRNNGLFIWPSITSETLNIELLDESDQIEGIFIFNLAGQEISNDWPGQNSINTKINVEGIPSGTYILLLQTKNHSYTERFIKK